MQPKQVEALFERGNNFIRMGNPTAAQSDYTTVLTHRPDFAPAYFNRGICRLQLGDYLAARDDFDATLRLQPAFPEALVNRAIIHQYTGDDEAALTDYSAALAHNPALSQALVNRGEVHCLRGDFQAALADFRAAHDLKAGYRYALAGQAVCLHHLGQAEEAARLWAGLVTRNAGFQDLAWVGTTLGWPAALLDLARPLIEHNA